MSSYTETKSDYAANRTMLYKATAELEQLEADLLERITWLRWHGTDDEILCARVQAELEIRTRSAKRQAA